METKLEKAMFLQENTIIEIGGASYVITNVTAPTAENNVAISAHMLEDVDRDIVIIVHAYRFFNYQIR